MDLTSFSRSIDWGTQVELQSDTKLSKNQKVHQLSDFKMLTEREKHGISELLLRMNSKDLASLAQTVTSRLIIPETSGEAVNAILLHTDRPAGKIHLPNPSEIDLMWSTWPKSLKHGLVLIMSHYLVISSKITHLVLIMPGAVSKWSESNLGKATSFIFVLGWR